MGLAGLQVAQYGIRLHMQESLEHAALQTVKLSPDGLQWVRPGKELLVHEKLFDVHHITYAQDSVTIVGLFDDEESEINAALTKEAQNGPGMKLLLRLMQCCQLFAEPNNYPHLLVESTAARNYHQLSILFITQYRSVKSPPPKAFTPSPLSC